MSVCFEDPSSPGTSFFFRSFFLVTLGTHLFFFYKQEEMEQDAFYISQTRNQQTSNSLWFCGWSTKTTSQQMQKKCLIMFLHRHCSFSIPRFKFVNLETEICLFKSWIFLRAKKNGPSYIFFTFCSEVCCFFPSKKTNSEFRGLWTFFFQCLMQEKSNLILLGKKASTNS